MKTTINLLLAVIMTAICCSIGSAQIIYSNAFNGGTVTINGTAPTVANDYAGGTAAALWNSVTGTNDPMATLANGTVDTHANSVLLPFTPEPGYVYTLTASATLPAVASGKWINWGFAQSNPVNNATPRFADSPVNGYAFAIGTAVAGSETFFGGPRAAAQIGSSQQLMPAAGTHMLQVKLD